MKPIRKEGKLPVNARISIDYEKEKPKIKFSYPRKDIITQNYELVFLILAFLFLACYFYFKFFGFPFVDYYNVYPTFCNTTINNNGTVIKNITLACDNEIKSNILFTDHRRAKNKYFNYIFSEFNSFYIDSSNSTIEEIISVLSPVFLLVFIIFFSLLLSKPITRLLVKCSWFKRKVPKINGVINGRCHKAIFKKVPENLIIEIPLFNNIKMNYMASKEFSKYLKKVEIKEHPFNSVLVRRRKIKKKKKNIRYWYARFYFTQQAKTGKLEVLFK